MTRDSNELGVYSIQDVKTCYIGITTGYGDEDAVRSFMTALRNDSNWFFNASDYRVVRIGSFDPETGVITPLSIPRVLAEGAQLKSLVEKEGEKGENNQ